MTCHGCEGLGLIPYIAHDWPGPDVEATFEDLRFAVCLCPTGQSFRLDSNNGRKTTPQWLLWCFRYGVASTRVAMVEDVFSAEELKDAGLTKQPLDFNREAALLAAGKKAKR